MEWGRRAGLAAAVLGLLACDESDDCRLVQCDVRERSCQAAVMMAVACMRGGDAKLPAVFVVDRAELAAKLAEQDDAESDEAAAAAYALWTRGLALFGLAPADYDRDRARADVLAQTAAVYLPESKEVWVVHEAQASEAEGVEVLAHELVHVLQDRELDLSSYEDSEGGGFDAALARRALIEGEALHYQVLAAVALAGRSSGDLDWMRFYDGFRGRELLDAEKDEAPVTMARARFPYAFGGGFVSQHWLASGRAGIDALFDDPPASSREIMFGPTAYDMALEVARDQLVARGVPQLPPSYETQHGDELGAWVTRAFAGRTALETFRRLDAPRVLAADLFSVHHDPTADTVVAAWRARALTGASLSGWPALTPFVRAPGVEGFTGPGEADAFAVGAEGALPVAAQMLEWRAPDLAPGDADTRAASTTGMPALFSRHALACPVRKLAL